MSSSAQPPLAPESAEYDRFAAIYDRHMAVDFARRVMPALEQLVLRKLPPGAALLDLCCGSGRVTQALVERGFRVTGVDASEPMLRLARRHAPSAEFVLADMCTLALASTYDAVVSTFNALAHALTFSHLQRVLGNAHAALSPGGVIVFDLSMHEQYQRRWHDRFSYVGPDGACIVRPSYNASQHIARNDITVFPRAHTSLAPSPFPRASRLQTGNQKMETSSFTIFQKCYTESEVRRGLSAVGFRGIQSFDAERDLGMTGESGRRFFRAFRGSC